MKIIWTCLLTSLWSCGTATSATNSSKPAPKQENVVSANSSVGQSMEKMGLAELLQHKFSLSLLLNKYMRRAEKNKIDLVVQQETQKLVCARYKKLIEQCGYLARITEAPELNCPTTPKIEVFSSQNAGATLFFQASDGVVSSDFPGDTNGKFVDIKFTIAANDKLKSSGAEKPRSLRIVDLRGITLRAKGPQKLITPLQFELRVNGLNVVDSGKTVVDGNDNVVIDDEYMSKRTLDEKEKCTVSKAERDDILVKAKQNSSQADKGDQTATQDFLVHIKYAILFSAWMNRHPNSDEAITNNLYIDVKEALKTKNLEKAAHSLMAVTAAADLTNVTAQAQLTMRTVAAMKGTSPSENELKKYLEVLQSKGWPKLVGELSKTKEHEDIVNAKANQ